MTTLIRSRARPSGRGLVQRMGARATPAGPGGFLIILVLAVAVLAVGVGALYQQARTAHLTEQARAAAMDAARSHAEEILSYDYRTLDHDIAQAKADTTGELRKEYANLTSKLVSPKAKKHKVVVRADVVGTAVVTASPERVVALLFVNQSTRSDLLKGPRIDQNRVRMTLTKVDGQWLAAKLAAL